MTPDFSVFFRRLVCNLQRTTHTGIRRDFDTLNMDMDIDPPPYAETYAETRVLNDAVSVTVNVQVEPPEKIHLKNVSLPMSAQDIIARLVQAGYKPPKEISPERERVKLVITSDASGFVVGKGGQINLCGQIFCRKKIL